MDGAETPRQRRGHPAIAALIGLVCAAACLFLTECRLIELRPAPGPSPIPFREEMARLNQAVDDASAPLDRLVTYADARGRIDDAFAGWGGPAVQVAPGQALEGFGGQYRLFRFRCGCPLEHEGELLRRLMAIQEAPRWLSGRRATTGGSVTWEVVLAFRAGPLPDPAMPRRPGAKPTAPAVERLTQIRAPSPRARVFRGIPPPRPIVTPPPPQTSARLDLATAWSGRVEELAAAIAAIGCMPGKRLVAEGPPPDVSALQVERTLVNPDRPWSSYAIIDGRLVRPGDSVRGTYVRAILPDRVLLGGANPIEVPVQRGR